MNHLFRWNKNLSTVWHACETCLPVAYYAPYHKNLTYFLPLHKYDFEKRDSPHHCLKVTQSRGKIHEHEVAGFLRRRTGSCLSSY